LRIVNQFEFEQNYPDTM